MKEWRVGECNDLHGLRRSWGFYKAIFLLDLAFGFGIAGGVRSWMES